MHLRHCHEIDIAVDTTEAEHVLVFQITAVRPAIDFYGNIVGALAHILRYVKLCIVVGTLTVADLLAVHPKIHGTIHTVEVDIYLLVGPVGRQRELAAV